MLKKILCFLTAGLMTAALLIAPASAEDFKELAKSLSLGKQVSGKLKYDGEFNDYKITMPSAGTLTLTFETYFDSSNGTYLSMYDADDRYVEAEEFEMIAGTGTYDDGNHYRFVIDSVNSKKNKTILTYELKKGTYYIRLFAINSYGTNYDFKMSVKANDLVEEPLFVIKIGAGKSATLGTTFVIDEDSDEEITWKSSKTSVAKVSGSGKITGVKKGTADITAKYGNKEIMIRVNVT